MKKKLFASLLTSAVVLLMVGCSNEAPETTDTEESVETSSEQVTLDVFNIKTETAAQMDALVEMFETQHEHIEINMTTVGGGTDAGAALQAKFASGEEPSIFMLGGLSDAQTWEHTLYDLNDTEIAGLAIEGTLEGATLDDRVLGVPMNIEGYGWMVNKEIFENAGVDIDSIDSFESFKTAVETIDAKKEELEIDGVFAFSGGEKWVFSQFSSHLFAPEFNNSLLETYDAATLELAYEDILKDYVDLADQYNIKPIEAMDYSTSVEELFASGKAAIIHQGNWIVPTLNSLDESFASEKLDIIPFFVEEENIGKITAGPAWYWAVNSNHDQATIDASIEFLTWMYTNEDAMASIINEFEFIPAYTNFENEDITDPVSQKIFDYLSNDLTVPWVHNSYPEGYGENTLGVQLQAYTAEQITWDEFTSKLIEVWNSERAE